MMWEFHQVWNMYLRCLCVYWNTFGHSQVRERAIAALGLYVSNQTPKNTVLLAKKYRVVDWLRTAYQQLVKQPSLGIPDLRGPEPLDWETIARIFFIRQTVTQNQPAKSVYCYNCCGYYQGSACNRCNPSVILVASSSELEEIFRDEFESTKRQSDQSKVDPPLPCTWVFGSYQFMPDANA